MNSSLVLKTKVDTKNFDRQISELERKLKSLEKSLRITEQYGIGGKDSKRYKQIQLEIEKTKNKLVGLYTQQNKINNQGFGKMQQAIIGIKDKAESVGRSILKWGLALIGIRGGIMFLRSSLSTLSQYDEQLAKNLEYIRYALAMTLKPVIEYIVDLVFRLLQYMNEISKEWFGIDLFANASAKSMEKAQKSASKMTKDLFGWDRINKLNAQKSTGIGSVAPSYDLSKGLQGKRPEWLQWIIDNKDEILGVLEAITLYLLGTKLGLDPVTSIGLAGLVLSLAEAFETLDTWYKEVEKDGGKIEGHFQKLGEVLIWLGIAIAIVGALFFGIEVIVAGVVLAIIGMIVGCTDEVKENWEDARKSWENISRWLEENLGFLGEYIAEWVGNIISVFEDLSIGVVGGFSEVVAGIFLLFTDLDKGIETIMRGIYDMVVGVINMLIDALNEVLTPIRAVIVGLAQMTGQDVKLSSFAKIPRLNYSWQTPKNLTSTFGSTVSNLTSSVIGTRQTLEDNIRNAMNVRLNITNEIDGRVLSRTLKELNSNNNFAKNGG